MKETRSPCSPFLLAHLSTLAWPVFSPASTAAVFLRPRARCVHCSPLSSWDSACPCVSATCCRLKPPGEADLLHLFALSSKVCPFHCDATDKDRFQTRLLLLEEYI